MPEFPTTRWTQIGIVQDRKHPEHRQTLDWFVRDYSPPIFRFLRANGQSRHDAEDLTQEFLTAFVLQREWVADADPQKGHFRNFLCVVLKRFVSDRTTERARQQDQFEQANRVSIHDLLSEKDRQWEPARGETPEEAFDRRWAQTVMAKVLQEFRKRCADEKHLEWATIYESYHAPEGEPLSQEAIAEQFELTRDQVRGILDKAEKLLNRLLRQEIRDQVGDESEIDDEIQELRRLLAGDSR